MKTFQRARAIAIFSLNNVTCLAHQQIESKLKLLHGVVAVNVNHVTDTVSVKFDPTMIRGEYIRDYLKNCQGEKRRIPEEQ